MFRYIVPDSCSLGAAYFQERDTANAAPLLRAIRLQQVDAISPVVGIGEFLNICRKKLLEGVPLADVDSVVADFVSLPIVWLDVEHRFASGSWSLYRAFKVGTNDAFFLQLAKEMNAELWTIDSALVANGSTVYPKIYDLSARTFA